MKIIDLRSDTVTLPTDEMRQAIFRAELGDDVFGEDPTTNRLEQEAAALMGKEAGLLVASGTMGNLVCTLTHCRRGEEVILGDKAHMFLNEAGGMSALGGIHPHVITNHDDGTMHLEDIKEAIRGDNVHFPRTRLICLENTHNRCYGAALTTEYMASVAELAKDKFLSVHLDGARIFNAAVTLNVNVKEFTRHVDSLSFCLSKGLSAPIGSVVCGSKKFIAEARRTRKVLGGGMRQSGIIAAAGLVAVEKMVSRLATDHVHARVLAHGISKIPGLSCDLAKIHTNIVYFDLIHEKIATDDLVKQSDNQGLKFLRTGAKRFRMLTHYGIEKDDITNALDLLKSVMERLVDNVGKR